MLICRGLGGRSARTLTRTGPDPPDNTKAFMELLTNNNSGAVFSGSKNKNTLLHLGGDSWTLLSGPFYKDLNLLWVSKGGLFRPREAPGGSGCLLDSNSHG